MGRDTAAHPSLRFSFGRGYPSADSVDVSEPPRCMSLGEAREASRTLNKHLKQAWSTGENLTLNGLNSRRALQHLYMTPKQFGKQRI